MVALPNTAREHAAQFANRLHQYLRVELSRFSVGDSSATVSMNVTTMVPEDCSYEDTLKRADRALYEAKGMGKDRIFDLIMTPADKPSSQRRTPSYLAE